MSGNKIEIFQSSNGEIEFKGDVSNETIWATQKQLAKLFGTKVPVINKHIKNIIDNEELNSSKKEIKGCKKNFNFISYK